MRLLAFVEPIPTGGFRASCNGPIGLSAEGATADEAVEHLKGQVQGRLAAGGHVVEMDVADEDHPLAPFEGMFRENPLFDDWQREIAEYRRQVDEDPDAL